MLMVCVSAHFLCMCVRVSVHVLYRKGLIPSCRSVFEEIAIDESHLRQRPHTVLKAVHVIVLLI